MNNSLFIPTTRHHLSDAPVDFILIAALLLTMLGGLLVLYSASDQNLQLILRQALYISFGLAAAALVARFSTSTLLNLGPWAIVLGLLLLLVPLLLGDQIKGSQRWINLPFHLSLQPSEFVKVLLPLGIAAILARSQKDQPLRMVSIVICLIATLLSAFLVAMAPDLGSSIMVATMGLLVIFLAGISRRLVLTGTLLMGLAALASWPLLREYQKQRILTLLDPTADPLGAGWNIQQSMIAVGSGGIEGRGYLRGTQAQLDFLPESTTDFIFAILAEELGLFGCLVLFCFYTLIIWRVVRLIQRAQGQLPRLFGGAFIIVFLFQTLLNLAMVTGLIPVVGLPLPLISQGGSAKVALIVGFGMIIGMCYSDYKDRAR